MLTAGRRVIYTTPLKALSNQKLGELRARFGHDNAGLQTGDASINIDSSVVVSSHGASAVWEEVLFKNSGFCSSIKHFICQYNLQACTAVCYFRMNGR